MEVEIADYLTKVSEGRLSNEGKAKVKCIMREVSELESICDSCYNIARTLNRKFKSKDDFIQSQTEHVNHMMELVNEALRLMQ